MPLFWQNDVILASRCHQIDFLMIHFVIIYKKRMPISLFKISLYVSQNAEILSAKLRNFSFKMSPNLFFNVTFLYQF